MGIFETRQRLFAKGFNLLTPIYDDALQPEKEALFAKIKDQVSHSPELRDKGALRIVELGAGSGSNLKYLPTNCHYSAVDPNTNFEKYFMESLAQNPGITFEGFFADYAEDLTKRFPDGSVDVVIGTAVFCTIQGIQKAYDEIKRILAPDGRYYFIEHILGRKGSWTLCKQRICSATKLWTFFGCGCEIDRKTDKQILLAGFSSVTQHLFKIPKLPVGIKTWHFTFARQHVAGIAEK